jgi:hypothetical protein
MAMRNADRNVGLCQLSRSALAAEKAVAGATVTIAAAVAATKIINFHPILLVDVAMQRNQARIVPTADNLSASRWSGFNVAASLREPDDPPRP